MVFRDYGSWTDRQIAEELNRLREDLDLLIKEINRRKWPAQIIISQSIFGATPKP